MAAEADWLAGSHVFVLSNAGKPVFSTAGGEADLSSLSALIGALISFARGPSGADELQSVEGGGRRVVFVVREPLYLVAVTDAREPAARAARCLHYVHLSIVRILTGSIEKVLARDATYDLRALLGGTDRALRGMVEHARSRPDVMLDAVPCVPLPSATRAEFGRLLLLVQSECAVLFAVLCAHGMLVSAASPRRRPLSAPDLILLLSMLRTSPSLRASADESWVPVCLPGFAPSAFLHAHVSTLDGASDLTLLLLTHSADGFEHLKAARLALGQRLSGPTLHALRAAVAPDAREVDASSLGIRTLRHFLFLDRAASAHVCARFPRSTPGLATGSGGADADADTDTDTDTDARDEASSLLDGYAVLRGELHGSTASLSVLFVADGRRALLGQSGREHELYTAHDPLCSKAEAGAAAQQLLRWLQRERGMLLLEKQLAWPG